MVCIVKFLSISNLWISDDHHVDDEDEAAAFINDRVRNSTAFLIDIDPNDTEQDCTAVPGTTQFHEMRYACKKVLL